MRCMVSHGLGSKYFAERMPELAVCAAGSLLGVHLGESSFPVGKVDELRMGPLIGSRPSV